MNRFGVALLVGAMTTLVAAPACSQQPPGRGLNMMGLATQKSVQEDAKITADQAKTLQEASDKQREAMRSLGENASADDREAKRRESVAENDKLLAATLSSEQMTRLKQIAIQAAGLRATENADVAAALKLTDEQKEKLAEIRKETRGPGRGPGGGGGGGAGGDREAMRKAMTERRKASMEKLLAVLTDDQKTKWKELTGEPFKGELQFGGFGGGGRGGRNRGGAGRPTNDK